MREKLGIETFIRANLDMGSLWSQKGERVKKQSSLLSQRVTGIIKNAISICRNMSQEVRNVVSIFNDMSLSIAKCRIWFSFGAGAVKSFLCDTQHSFTL